MSTGGATPDGTLGRTLRVGYVAAGRVPNRCGCPWDQRHELENLRRSLAMLNPGATASLSREEAMRLITDVADLQARLERLRVGLRQLVDTADDPSA